MKKIVFIALVALPFYASAQYTGTAAVTRGLAATTTTNLFTCTGGRVTNLGSITATNNTVWTVPAATNFSTATFPFASDLNNSCNGANYATSAAALAALNGSDIVTIDATGEVITAYIFADNYFEMYINGVPVGKDKVPFTPFNSSIIRFKVKKPFTIALVLVDWEESLGVGCENNNGFNYHIGDGGMVAIFKDVNNNVIDKTGSNWKAQTFYTAPIKDLTCPTENGTARLTTNCATTDSNDGTAYYALHWAKPANWTTAAFDDSAWKAAYTYTNAVVGVDNKPAYTNFTNIFDDAANDAQFIWSSNLILDNEVVVRHTVLATSTSDNTLDNNAIDMYPNPTKHGFSLGLNGINAEAIQGISIVNSQGQVVFKTHQYQNVIETTHYTEGAYFVKIQLANGGSLVKKLIVH